MSGYLSPVGQCAPDSLPVLNTCDLSTLAQEAGNLLHALVRRTAAHARSLFAGSTSLPVQSTDIGCWILSFASKINPELPVHSPPACKIWSADRAPNSSTQYAQIFVAGSSKHYRACLELLPSLYYTRLVLNDPLTSPRGINMAEQLKLFVQMMAASRGGKSTVSSEAFTTIGMQPTSRSETCQSCKQ